MLAPLRHIAERFFDSAPLYAFCTENIKGYLPFLKCEGGKVLCVAGSGDHALNSIWRGANDITMFDVNSAALRWAELKIAAVRSLDLAAFERFFFLFDENDESPNRDALSFATYEQLRSSLLPETAEYFDHCYVQYGFKGEELRRSDVFNNRHDCNSLKVESNLYLQDRRSFELLKTALGAVTVRYMHSCVSKLSSKLDNETFDLVLLSNIADYAEELFPGDNSLVTFFREIVLPLRARLNNGGILCAAYLYAPGSNRPPHSLIDVEAERRKVCDQSDLSYAELSFRSVMPEEKDLVLVISGEGGRYA